MNKKYFRLIPIFYMAFIVQSAVGGMPAQGMTRNNGRYLELPSIDSKARINQRRINAILAKWQLRTANYATITGSWSEIKSDKQVLKKAMKSKIHPHLAHQIGQTLTMIYLSELRLLIWEAKNAEEAFPSSFADYTNTLSQAQTPAHGEGALKVHQWYEKKTQRLYELMKKFQQFLSRNPSFYYNPPPFLRGVGQTYRDGIEAFGKLKQLSACFKHPQSQKCIALGTKKPKAQRQRPRPYLVQKPYAEQPEEEYDDRDDASESEEEDDLDDDEENEDI